MVVRKGEEGQDMRQGIPTVTRFLPPGVFPSGIPVSWLYEYQNAGARVIIIGTINTNSTNICANNDIIIKL